ncbi:MAG: DUF4349 domain-containing protein [Defluviitaleaceae bacterium]|nr:DUF4349 domain-containing protein [Defluviitaleaceae bacterium]MCL2836019.1 DUF4349 domain-containing protein [Defluviitaleaceae bacterium]
MNGILRFRSGTLILAVIAITALLSGCRRNQDAGYGWDTSSPRLYESNYAIMYDSDYADYMYTGLSHSSNFSAPPSPAGNIFHEELETRRNRQIIRNGSVYMSTRDFDTLTSYVLDLVESFNGYIESTDKYTTHEGLRNQSFSLRVPSGNFEAAMRGIESQGGVRNSSRGQSDVTDHYYDIAARLDARTIEEQRLLELIAQAREIADLILLEQRLSQVRQEIESMRGQLQGMDRRVSYSQIWLSITEERGIYEPGTLLARVAKAFTDSIDATAAFAQTVLVFLVSAIIPLIFIALMLLVGRFTFRRLVRRRRKRKPAVDKSALKAVKLLVEDAKDEGNGQ